MTIIEAIKSGKEFRRPHMKGFYEIPYPRADGWYFRHEDLLADDWEVEEKKVEITYQKLRDAYCSAMPGFVEYNASRTGPTFIYPDFDKMAKDLGLID